MTIRKVGVCGAGGTMGAGIAIATARGGFDTVSFDVSQAALDQAEVETVGFFGRSVERGKLEASERTEILRRMSKTTKLDELADCDLVIEAVFEDLSVKQELVAKLDRVCSEKTIFASNTSTLSISEIASAVDRQDRVVGMHFCLPAQLMKLVEISAGMNTSRTTFETVWHFAEAMNQKPVETQDKPGFILNAFVVPFNNDAIRAVEAGVAAPEEIDRALKVGLGYRMGPLELLDMIGLDTQVRLCEAFYPITLDPRAAAPPLLRRMVAAGHLGRKSGRGFYTYEGAKMFGSE